MEYSYHFSRLRVQGSNSGLSTSTFPYMMVISILGNCHCNSKVCCFQIHFVLFYRSRRELQRIAAVMLQTISSFYAKISEKSLFFSANTYEKYIVCKDYCIAHHNDKTRFLSACKYHNILLGEIEELLHILDTFCFTYQHADCLYTLFEYQFNEKIIAVSGNVFDNVQRAIYFNQRNRGVDKCRVLRKTVA